MARTQELATFHKSCLILWIHDRDWRKAIPRVSCTCASKTRVTMLLMLCALSDDCKWENIFFIYLLFIHKGAVYKGQLFFVKTDLQSLAKEWQKSLWMHQQKLRSEKPLSILSRGKRYQITAHNIKCGCCFSMFPLSKRKLTIMGCFFIWAIKQWTLSLLLLTSRPYTISI